MCYMLQTRCTSQLGGYVSGVIQAQLECNINFMQKPLEVRAQSGFRLCADHSGRVQRQSMCFTQTDLAHL